MAQRIFTRKDGTTAVQLLRSNREKGPPHIFTASE